jgi:hypothetical protein
MFDDDTQIAVHRELVTGMDKGGGVGNAGDTGDPYSLAIMAP